MSKATKKAAEQEEQSFEQAMHRLEEIVDKLEGGELELETAINLFQEGMTLSKHCHDKLHKIEQQVKILMHKDGELKHENFSVEEEPS